MEPLIFELSVKGRRAVMFTEVFPRKYGSRGNIPAEYLREDPPMFPEVSELDITRHFTRLSRMNYSVDTVMYPLGSCTMKYSPKVCEEILRYEGFADIHPYLPESQAQGILGLIYRMQEYLCGICGMDDVSLQPAAGAHGELLGMLLVRAYHRDRGDIRSKIIVPDTSHGTNPSSARTAGYNVVTIPSNEKGEVDMRSLRDALDRDTAAVMLTNPNTLGIFESRILDIAEAAHRYGALLYGDGANLNALLGRVRPGDMGFDLMHVNLHKTFSTPHGGGGPGSGPVLVKRFLSPYLPVPRVVRRAGRYSMSYGYPKTVGRVRAFYGNIGVVIRAFAYITALGKNGLKNVSGRAVLNANYMRTRLKEHIPAPYDRACMHEFVLSSAKHNALSIAKRLLERGFYAPTIYFPLTVKEALMIEPTETESKDTMDRFIKALIDINSGPLSVTGDDTAPRGLPVGRLDEVSAARNPDLAWKG